MRTVQRGVTLVELAVVMAVAAILLTQAVPSFSAWMQNVQIRTATESIQNGLQLARAEAIRRNRSVEFWLTSTATPMQADWMVGCAINPVNTGGPGPVAEAPGDCPGTPAGAAPYNWIQRQNAADQQTANPQVTPQPAGSVKVTFNSLGMAVANNDGTLPLTQIQLANPSMAAAVARPLWVQISGGQIRMCDPNLNRANDPRGC